MTKEVTVWKAFLDGECKQIADTVQSLWEALRRNSWYNPAERHRWTTAFEQRQVPVTQGTWILADRHYVDLEAPIPDDFGPPQTQAPHILWQCPICGQDHLTDVEPGDNRETLWLCEGGTMDDIVLVRWQEPSKDRETDHPSLN